MSLDRQFIDPSILAGIGNLQLLAKSVVEGFVTGLHRSPFHGFSLDFMEYREYTPGDDIRGIDWKVYARSDRFYVKKYQGDTNTRINILLDTSASMNFTSHKASKLDYGRFLAASLAHFATTQKDAVGLLTFDTVLREYIPPRIQAGQLMRILSTLEKLERGGQTNIGGVLDEIAALVNKRGILILISDFYQSVDEIAKALRYFHFKGHDIILFHLLDPVELELPLGQTQTLEDMETQERVPYDPERSRQAYLDLLNKHIEDLRRECGSSRIDYVLLNTAEPLDMALRRYLTLRQRQA